MDRSAKLISLENRHSCKRKKKTSMSDIREIYNDETRQRGNKEKEEKQKHINFIQSICNHGQSLIQWHRATNSKRLKLGRSVLNYHAQVEKEEQKRAERISKERLRALKDDDEEAYLKLIDQAKDTRITHLLKQTDSYLDSLAQAVVAQQNDELHNDPSVRGGIELMDEEEDEDNDTMAIVVCKKKKDFFFEEQNEYFVYKYLQYLFI
jgi:ATP-dependent helicase STH1/SNF2